MNRFSSFIKSLKKRDSKHDILRKGDPLSKEKRDEFIESLEYLINDPKNELRDLINGNTPTFYSVRWLKLASVAFHFLPREDTIYYERELKKRFNISRRDIDSFV